MLNLQDGPAGEGRERNNLVLFPWLWLVRFRICITQRWLGMGDDKLPQLQSFDGQEQARGKNQKQFCVRKGHM